MSYGAAALLAVPTKHHKLSVGTVSRFIIPRLYLYATLIHKYTILISIGIGTKVAAIRVCSV